MSDNIYTPFAIGAEVHDLRHGRGEVIAVKFGDTYPVKVQFETGYKDCYLVDGRVWASDKHPMLYECEMLLISKN